VAWHDVDDHLGWGEQADGRYFLGLFVENGRIKDDDNVQLRSFLRRVMQELRPGVRLTGQQNIILTDIGSEQRPDLAALLREYGVSTDPAAAGLARHAMACPALPTCGLALADAERSLPSVVRQVEADLAELQLADQRLSIRMTGCPNGCARPYMGDLGFVGRTKDVYNIYVGGDWENTRLNTLYADSVPLHRLSATVRPLLVLWKEERLPDETFGDYCHRLGVEELRVRAESLVHA
jgi:sulfite reductase (ferredoxin)